MTKLMAGVLLVSFTVLAGCANWPGQSRSSDRSMQTPSGTISPGPTGGPTTSHDRVD